LKDPAESSDSAFIDVCDTANIPIGNPTGPSNPATPLAFNLISQGTWFDNTFGSLGAAGRLLTIANGEDFEVQLIADQNMPGGCDKSGNINLSAHQSIPAIQIYGSNVSYPKLMGVCAPSALTIERPAVGIVITYKPN
jgi:hypothetical protein